MMSFIEMNWQYQIHVNILFPQKNIYNCLVMECFCNIDDLLFVLYNTSMMNLYYSVATDEGNCRNQEDSVKERWNRNQEDSVKEHWKLRPYKSLAESVKRTMAKQLNKLNCLHGLRWLWIRITLRSTFYIDP